jgi:hypothetical protein
MNESAKERLAQIMALQAGLQAAWPTLQVHLEKRRLELITKLVSTNDEGVRGRIKEVDNLLGLPEELQQEAIALAAPQQEGELP